MPKNIFIQKSFEIIKKIAIMFLIVISLFICASLIISAFLCTPSKEEIEAQKNFTESINRIEKENKENYY
jgi:hypothetical protein